MTVALRTVPAKYLLVAAGVLLGLLTIALMLFAGSPAASSDLINGATNQFQHTDSTRIVAGVLWH